MQTFISHVADVLNKNNPLAFALLHGGHYTGTTDEVNEFYVETEKAVQQFNSKNSDVFADVLRRQEVKTHKTILLTIGTRFMDCFSI